MSDLRPYVSARQLDLLIHRAAELEHRARITEKWWSSESFGPDSTRFRSSMLRLKEEAIKMEKVLEEFHALARVEYEMRQR